MNAQLLKRCECTAKVIAHRTFENSGDILGCHCWGGGCYGHLVGQGRVHRWPAHRPERSSQVSAGPWLGLHFKVQMPGGQSLRARMGAREETHLTQKQSQQMLATPGRGPLGHAPRAFDQGVKSRFWGKTVSPDEGMALSRVLPDVAVRWPGGQLASMWSDTLAGAPSASLQNHLLVLGRCPHWGAEKS